MVRKEKSSLRLAMLFSMLALALIPQTAWSKPWRGIVPLKSTRVDIERRFGKPDRWGGYDLKDERVSFEYREGTCKGLYLSLGADNCKCLANEGAVMSILVEPLTKRRASDLKLDLKTFKKTPINPFPHTFEYYNLTEGVVYTVDDVDDEIKHITYYPSVEDCQEIIAKRAQRNRNSWRGLVPLHSNRRDVERLLGARSPSQQTLVTYNTDYENVVAKYSDRKCDIPSSDWNVAAGTLIELVVNPKPSFFLKELHLDSTRYKREEIAPNPEINDAPKVWTYIDSSNGIIIRTQSNRGREGDEIVVSIKYLPSKKDDGLRCGSKAKSNNTKR